MDLRAAPIPVRPDPTLGVDMATLIETFFSAWGMTDADAGANVIAGVFAAQGTYIDPRAPGVLTGPTAIATYVAGFGANAPGWAAEVVKADTIAGLTRATIAFCGKGADGQQVVQHGQYFVEITADRIARMVGFAGTGLPA